MQFKTSRASCGLGMFILSLAILLLPISWILAWGISVLVHEGGHLLAAKWLSIPVYGIQFSLSGARIQTAPMEPVQELLCAFSGPLAGILLIWCGRWLPITALFAFFHTAWNLLPVGSSDGARVLRSISVLLEKFLAKQP